MSVGFLLSALVVAAVIDARTHRVPNVLCAALLLAGLVLGARDGGADGVVAALLGAGVGLLAFLPFYALGGMAAGDVKLMAGAGAMLGPWSALVGALFSLVAGGMLALMFVVVRVIAAGVPSDVPLGAALHPSVLRARYGNARFPYAAAVLAGVAFSVLLPLGPA